jgi:hypothetical protein
VYRGPYWESLFEIPGFRQKLVVKTVTVPERVFGVPFYWNAHKVNLYKN